ncbi:Cell division cycle protein 23-like protein [Armadillidium nasatum]|uniref:Cell division cycle protein 23-like protein n=1 Tax=Armadillidium nasatum TaxID=96803 RepID=A0A5N5SL80_9CRUS|nr:Cell division cycle protein 23-like protein [Armadillidium nasatum]
MIEIKLKMSSYLTLHDKSSGKFGITHVSSESLTSDINEELLVQIKRDLVKAKRECCHRRLLNSEKWMGEMLDCITDVKLDDPPVVESLEEVLGQEINNYERVRPYFDLKEYDRAAYFTENCSKPLTRFLHLLCPQHNSPHLKDLQNELSLYYTQSDIAKNGEDGLDAYQLWLYGAVLKHLDLRKQAAEILCESIALCPSHWGAWLELASLITDKEMMDNLKLPEDHWMHKLFVAHVYLELHINDEAAKIYTDFVNAGLKNSVYIKAQMVLVLQNQKALDPFRLENVDVYSNLLYVQEMRVDLSHLAHRVVTIDKYRVETCCVIGNYYSLRGQHEKAVQYFQRALRLNPHYLVGWTLMGHEYMEMKNTNAAIQCYRQAIEVNSRDYRAWYGLGQTYEVLKLPSYCIYYYKQAHRLRPNDSRTLIALGDSYEKLEKWEEAKKCYHHAHSIGDIEDLALLRLARLYGQLGEGERSAVVYERFLQETDDSFHTEDRGQAYLFLAEHCLQKNMLDLACEYALKQENLGKTILNEIATKRQNEEGKTDDCNSVLSTLAQQRHGRESDSPSTSRLPPLSFSP